MRYIHHLIDDIKFKFISDLDEIGHFEIIDSRSTILKDGNQEPNPGSDKNDNKKESICKASREARKDGNDRARKRTYQEPGR